VQGHHYFFIHSLVILLNLELHIFVESFSNVDKSGPLLKKIWETKALVYSSCVELD
jgi:hypothetical protein